MIRVFVYEHLCTQSDIGLSLRAEGRAMLAAALADLSACEGVEPVALVEPSLLDFVRAISPRITARAVAPGGEEVAFREAAAGCRFALVIAPEFDDILATRCEWALAAGCRLLGPSPEAVRLCADKLRLAECLRKEGVPVPNTTLYAPNAPPPDGFPCIVKPRTGAGSTATFRVTSPDQFVAAGEAARAQGFGGELIVQPFVRGTPASIAVMMLGPGRPLSMPVARQHIETTSPLGQMRYAGGTVGEMAGYGNAMMLAQSAWCCVEGLTGYFGFDLVIDCDARGTPNSGFWNCVVLEINPRLTTSYVGLRRLSNVNLMRVLLDAALGNTPPWPAWREGRVRFYPDGTVYESPS